MKFDLNNHFIDTTRVEEAIPKPPATKVGTPSEKLKGQ